jgi:hypothetical protein
LLADLLAANAELIEVLQLYDDLERVAIESSSNQPQSMQQQNMVPSQSSMNIATDRDRDGDSEPRQLTAIFRPDEAGEWKEKLRLSHEAEQARFARENQQAWDRRPEEDDGKDEDGEVDDDESSVVSDGEGKREAEDRSREEVRMDVRVCCPSSPLFITLTNTLPRSNAN